MSTALTKSPAAARGATAAGHDAPAIGHHVAGRSESGGARRAPIFDPATGHVIGAAVLADRAQVDRAVAAAKAALPGWSDTAPLKRARVLFKFRELLEAHCDELAALITREHGKTLSDS